ncbi:MAG: S41 family peptidase [Acholeplasmataceae bacterium]
MGTKKLAILFLFSVILAFAAGYFSSNLVESKMVIESDEIFNYITKAFDEYYYYDIDSDDVYDAFIESMYAVVDSYAANHNDPYTKITAVIPSVANKNVESYVGMGLDFYFDQNDLRVIDVDPTSDLYLKLYPYDLITGVMIDEQPIYFDDLASTDEVLTYLTGSVGDEKQIIVENPSDETYTVDFMYQEILTPSAYAKDLGSNDIGYIKIDHFNGYEQGVSVGTNYVFNEVLNTLESSILEGENKTLIIDLRDNPGGSLTALTNQGTNLNPGITQLLLPYNLSQPLFSMVDKKDDVTTYYGGLSQLKPYDIKVLVNGNSASASEVLAASLSTYGYMLYGSNTYGKGVYQNSIYLNDIRNISYYLTYTEGVWNYGDNLNVSTDPLLVESLDQSGILTLDLPIFMKELSYDQVDSNLINYQKFFNTYFNLDEGSMIRTDGYFDQSTEDYIKQYQSEHGIPQSGKIDLETARFVYLDFKVMSSLLSNDIQLHSLITLIQNQYV